MRAIKLYIAQSLDGYIADAEGGVDWLDQIPHPEQNDYGYTAFYESCDTTLMGNTTYQQVLGFDVPFPYPDRTNYVFTRDTSLTKDENVTFHSGDVVAFARDLKQQEGKDIWLVGGGQLNTLFANAGLIDEYWIFTMPVLLGQGIPLFATGLTQKSLRLVEVEKYTSGVLFMKYAPA